MKPQAKISDQKKAASPGILDFPSVPEELIAQAPLPKRDEARLMVVARGDGSLQHRRFYELDSFLSAGDALVLNDVRVFPARLIGRKRTGGRVSVLLLKRIETVVPTEDRWIVLLTPALRPGSEILFPEGLSARVERQRDSGEYEAAFSRFLGDDQLAHWGRIPLPPYIRRSPEDEREMLDKEYYQTVYARASTAGHGAVAAPTAGLHFTGELLDRIRGKGVETVSLCLDVGWGTFRPLKNPDFRTHRMLAEDYEIPEAVSAAVRRARKEGKRVWAVGTTAVRALESAVDETGEVAAGPGRTELYIFPGYRFKVVDALITNFHLPGYTPLLLAGAFAGADLLRRAYESAVEEKYRFFSYGDAMLIL